MATEDQDASWTLLTIFIRFATGGRDLSRWTQAGCLQFAPQKARASSRLTMCGAFKAGLGFPLAVHRGQGFGHNAGRTNRATPDLRPPPGPIIGELPPGAERFRLLDTD
jgi:hypothetical protein